MITQNREANSANTKTNRNKSKILSVLAAIPLLFVALILWGLVEPYFLDDEEETAVIPNLPAAWEGQKVAQVSDFQVGMWWDNTATVAKSVDKIIEEQPAAVLISGDFIYHAMPNPDTEIGEVVSLLRPLTEANIPTYAVLGNHDYGMKSQKMPPKTELANRLEQELEGIGIEVLNNEAVKLPLQNQESELYLVGVGAHWANNDDVDKALSQLPAASPRIAMMHNPDTFTTFAANTAPFAVAGHTHGGQIRLPYLPQWSWLSLAKKDEVFADAWIADEYGAEGNNLYVNRGIGFSEIPIRLNCAPEITFFTLTANN